MDAGRVFLDTLDDLEQRVDSPAPEYEVMMAAPLLRKLLLDDRRLVDEVNRERRSKVKYLINGREPIWKLAGSPPPVTWSREDGLDPDTALTSAGPVEVTRDQLLAKVVLVDAGHEVTVKDLIRHAAYVAGAVHIGTPETDRERALNDLATQWKLGGYSSAIGPLRAIGRVVLKGLAPLREAVEREGEVR